MSTRWDKARFGIERECTCRSRCAECATGWHRVDGNDDALDALIESDRLCRVYGFAYRVVAPDGRVLS